MPSDLDRVVSGPSFVGLVERLLALPWPVAVSDIGAAMASVGFSATDDERIFRSNLGVTNETAMALRARSGLAAVELMVADVRTDATAERDAFVQDAFASIVAAGRGAWGEPDVRRPGHPPRVIWFVDNGCNVIVDGVRSTVQLTVESPEMAAATRKLKEY